MTSYVHHSVEKPRLPQSDIQLCVWLDSLLAAQGSEIYILPQYMQIAKQKQG